MTKTRKCYVQFMAKLPVFNQQHCVKFYIWLAQSKYNKIIKIKDDINQI